VWLGGGDAAVRAGHHTDPAACIFPTRRLFISITCSNVIPSLASRAAAFGVGTIGPAIPGVG
jgi:hypothetical protein